MEGQVKGGFFDYNNERTVRRYVCTCQKGGRWKTVFTAKWVYDKT